MAIDYLPIQASAVPCKRVFSLAKETVTARRNRILSDLMEALQILKYAIIHGHGINFMDGLDKEAELCMLEELELSRCHEE